MTTPAIATVESAETPTTVIGSEEVSVTEPIVWERPFCRVISFERDHPEAKEQPARKSKRKTQ